jgi:hypothetical protein
MVTVGGCETIDNAPTCTTASTAGAVGWLYAAPSPVAVALLGALLVGDWELVATCDDRSRREASSVVAAKSEQRVTTPNVGAMPTASAAAAAP